MLLDAADADVAGHHACARGPLEEVEDLLALAEAVEKHRHGAQFKRTRAQPYQVAGDTLQLGQQDTQVLRALRDLVGDTQDLLDGQTEAQVVRERGEIVDAVRQRDRLGIGLRFARLLNARVEITDVGSGLHHGFSVQLEEHAKHAVRGRVLGSHVEDHGLARACGCLDRGHGLPSLPTNELVPFQLFRTNLSSAFGPNWEGILWRRSRQPRTKSGGSHRKRRNKTFVRGLKKLERH